VSSHQAAHPRLDLARPTAKPAGWVQKFVAPSIADCVFVAVLFWLFFLGSGATSLLGDGDTGWHIRAGEWVLAEGQFPHEDLFSFSMEGRQWFAWEWFADVLFALLHGAWGLRALVLLAGIVIAATAALLLRYMVWRGANLLVAILGTMAVCSASALHWLARPHMFTWGFLLLTLWLLESDRRRPSRAVWWLVPLVALWVNTHGGFAALLVTVAIYAAGTGAEELLDAWRRRNEQPGWLHLPAGLKRYLTLLAACCAATLINPYGWELHQHIFSYLGSDFILNNVQEFRAPDFRGESLRIFEVVLLLSLMFAGRLLAQRRVTEALLIAAWAHAALLSVRHVPLFMIVATPLLARELTLLLEQGAERGNAWLKILREIAEDYGGRTRAASEAGPVVLNLVGAAAIAVIAGMLWVHADDPKWKAEFPGFRFPKMAADSLEDRIVGRRLLSTDQWGDYLVYRFYPEFKTFIDGRSDFYDPSIRDEYVALMNGKWGWRRIMDKHGFEAALLPASWALTSTLKIDPGWRLVYDDGEALFFERAEPAGAPRRELAARLRGGSVTEAAKN
jgi:hypothetical protein